MPPGGARVKPHADRGQTIGLTSYPHRNGIITSRKVVAASGDGPSSLSRIAVTAWNHGERISDDVWLVKTAPATDGRTIGIICDAVAKMAADDVWILPPPAQVLTHDDCPPAPRTATCLSSR